MSDPIKRRRRPAVSCTLCRRRKIKCDRGVPCSNCTKSGNLDCRYNNDLPYRQSCPAAATPTVKLPLQTPPLSVPSPSIAAETVSSGHSLIESKITYLHEKWLAHRDVGDPSPSNSSMNISSSAIAGTAYMPVSKTSTGSVRAQGIVHKSRFFGVSHWANGVAYFLSIFESVDALVREESCSIIDTMTKCKQLGRDIKLRRTPSWPCFLGFDLPTKAVADSLLSCYLQTSESLYRIIHIPTFMRAYESMWAAESPPEDIFIVQLKLILAIGTPAYDDGFSLRSTGIRWIYEAKTWLEDPKSKSKPSIQLLQVNLLLVLAQDLLHTEADPAWVAVGAILRRAMHFGFHRDPDALPPMSVFAAETRRRLWNTILELAVQSSLASGGSPLLSMEDFDTRAPGNYDDDELLSGNPSAKLEASHTDTAISIALRNTLAARLAIVQHLNGLSLPGQYEETLGIDVKVKEVFKTLRRTVQGYISEGKLKSMQFEVQAVEFLANRFTSALHVPFLNASFKDPTYTYSRRVVVDASLKLWHAAQHQHQRQNQQSQQSQQQSPPEDKPIDSAQVNLLARLTICSSGTFRMTVMQALLLISLEIMGQIQDNDSLGPAMIRPDLLDIVHASQTWNLQTIEAGETNIKGMLLMTAVVAHIDGLLLGGVPKDQVPQLVVGKLQSAIDKGFELLAGIIARQQHDNTTVEATWSGQQPREDASFSTKDWDQLMSEAFVQTVADGDPMSWLMNEMEDSAGYSV